MLSKRAGQGRTLEPLRRNAANGLSVANLLAGLASVLCSLNRWEERGGGKKKGRNGVKQGVLRGVSRRCCPLGLPRQYPHSCWLLLVGFLLDLADGAVARHLNACSALGECAPPPQGAPPPTPHAAPGPVPTQ